MNDSRWRMGGPLFRAALSALGHTKLPYPLRCQPENEQLGGHDHAPERLQEQLRQLITEEFYTALVTVLHPELRITVTESPYGVRALAGITGRTATMVVQQLTQPGQGEPPLTVVQLPARQVAAELINTIPQRAGGTQKLIQASRDHLNYPIFLQDPLKPHPLEVLQKLTRKRRLSTGEIVLTAGTDLPRRQHLIWLDYPDDGRYLLHHHTDTDFTIAPGPADEFARQLNHHIHALSATHPHT